MVDSESMTNHSVFEGMFDRALRPAGSFAVALRGLGYDPERPELWYPTVTWNRALDVSREHLFPELSREDADRELGRRFIEGFFETITGKFVKLALPLVGPEGMLRRLPRYYQPTQTGTEIEILEDGPRTLRLRSTSDHNRPDFMVGLLEGVPNFGYRPEVIERSPESFTLRIGW